jgi:hypothetical protein
VFQIIHILSGNNKCSPDRASFSHSGTLRKKKEGVCSVAAQQPTADLVPCIVNKYVKVKYSFSLLRYTDADIRMKVSYN